MKFFDRVQSEDLPHESGIKTETDTLFKPEAAVGRLAPRIGD